MSKYKYSKETIKEVGYINPSEILSFVTEEEIYELVLGYQPKEFEYIKAPYRDDEEAGCWFEYGEEGKLWFRDFAYGNRPLDCFEMVKVYFKIPNFYETLKFIKATLIGNKKITKKRKVIIREPKIKGISIKILTRGLDVRDKNFWSSYGISKQNLIEDKVFPIQRCKIDYKDPKKENKVFTPKSISYAYTDFEKDKKKIYTPDSIKFKFLTNCTQNDIGSINHLPPFGRQLIISKAYKDCRVLRNLGLNSCWIQNEGQIPSKTILKDFARRFKKIVIFFDNDKAGKKASEKLKSHFEGIKDGVTCINIPEELLKRKVKDPSDMYKSVGRIHLINFLKQKKLL